MRRVCPVLLLCALATPLLAQDWAGKMFETTSHNFGTIARGAKAEFRFELENIYLTVHLDKNAPPGYIRQHLLLVTEGGQSGQIPILAEGQVLSDLTVSPSSLFLGVVRPGEKVARQIVVRSKRPFRITSMSGDCQCIQLSNVGKEARPLHIVPVTFLAGDQPGRVAPVIHLQTDLDHANADIPAYAVISSDR